jgi:hypothetical protein
MATRLRALKGGFGPEAAAVLSLEKRGALAAK